MRFRLVFSLFAIMCFGAPRTLNSRQAVSGSACPRITAENIAQLVPLQHIPDQHSVAQMQFSPDNRALITIQDVRGDETAQRWDLATAQKSVEVKLQHSDSPIYLVSSDGHYLAQGTAIENHVMQTPVTLYDMTTGTQLVPTPFDAEPLFFLTEQKSLVVKGTTDVDGSPYRIQWETGDVQQIFDLPGDKAMVAISPDLRWLVTTGIDPNYVNAAGGPLQLWESGTGRERTDLFSDATLFPDYDSFGHAAFSADSRYLIMLGKNETRLIDLMLAKLIAAFPTAGDRADISPDSHYAVVYYILGPTSKPPLPILDLTAGGRTIATLPADAFPVMFSADSRLLVYGQGTQLHVWDVDKRFDRSTIPVALDPDAEEPGTWQLSDDGSLFARYTSDSDSEHVTWWDTQTGQAIARYPMGKPIRFNADATRLATPTNMDEITVWGVPPCA